jgi:basic membrane protein A
MPSILPSQPTRRRLMQSAGILAATAMLPFGTKRAFAAKPLTVGFIYVGPKDDFGYNQAHAEGAAAVRDFPGVTVIEEEAVPESASVKNSLESMITFDGATLLFPTSFGYYDPFVKEVAPHFPEVRFQHCGGLWQHGDPVNAGSYFGYIAQGQYLNGIVAGYATKSKKIGFVAAKPIPQVLNNINSFLLGARAVDPEITCQVIFTGEWSLAVKEAEATNALTDQGVDVITCHVDSPKVVIETAAGRNCQICGYHTDQSALAPERYLTGAEWNWGKVYRDFVSQYMAGETIANFVRGGMAQGFVKMSPLGPSVGETARTRFEAVRAEMMAGGFAIIKGPLKDNRGAVITTAGQAFAEDDISLESMNYLVEGVIGSAG